MGWLGFGILYSVAYAIGGVALGDQSSALSWFRAVALFIPPLTGAIVIVRRRRRWRGCQWLFWATIGLGLTMSAIGLTGWAADELVSQQESWLAWPAVFALFGAVAPLFALLAQPHRGLREPLAATTAVDIAGLAVVTGFLYSFFVTAPTPGAALSGPEFDSLLLVSELQQALVASAMVAAMLIARHTPWRDTYRRLALGAWVGFVMLTLSNFDAVRGFYRPAFVYDFTWILPFTFYPWAASLAPTSDHVESSGAEDSEELQRPRPWVIFAAVAMIPFLDFGLRRIAPGGSSGFRDLSTAVTFVSVLPLLVARIAAEKAELQQADGTMRLLTQVIEQAQDLILVLTPSGKVRHANLAFCRAIGIPRESLQAMHSKDLIAQGIVSEETVATVVNTGETWRGTFTRKRQDGTSFPVSAVMAAIVDEHGRSTHVVSVERDISEERRLREQLIHSERMAAVGQLVAGVAHELNNPLQTVTGVTDLMLATEQTPETRRDLSRVRLNAERAAKIVQNLLTFARRSARDRSLVDLNEVVESTLALKMSDLIRTNIAVRQDCLPDLPQVLASREEVRQVVFNLLQNASQSIRDTGKQGVIHVRTGTSAGSVFIEVEDDGPGVPTNLAGRIFEPFFTTKVVGQGTGLGLSISLGIAEAHGGSLGLKPTASGACFVLTLPVAPVPVQSASGTHALAG